MLLLTYEQALGVLQIIDSTIAIRADLTEEQMEDIAEKLTATQFVKELHFVPGGEYHIGLGDNVKILARSLRNNTTVTALNLCGNNIDDSGVIAVATMLRVNRTLRSLDLSTNKFTTKGMLAVATALKENTSLQNLRIKHWDHEIQEEEIQNVNTNKEQIRRAFEEALSSNVTLKRLDFSLLSDMNYDNIDRILKRNQQIPPQNWARAAVVIKAVQTQRKFLTDSIFPHTSGRNNQEILDEIMTFTFAETAERFVDLQKFCRSRFFINTTTVKSTGLNFVTNQFKMLSQLANAIAEGLALLESPQKKDADSFNKQLKMLYDDNQQHKIIFDGLNVSEILNSLLSALYTEKFNGITHGNH